MPFILKTVKHNKNKIIGTAATKANNPTLSNGFTVSSVIMTPSLYIKYLSF